MESKKRGAGRPRQGEGSEHVDLTLSRDVVTFLRNIPAGQRSKFVDEWIKQHPNYQRQDKLAREAVAE